jgi:O-antigen ligase
MSSGSLAAAIIADNPLTGVGFLEYESALPRYGGERAFNLGHPDGATANANNQILQTLTDAGVPGLLAFAVLMFCAARLLRELGAQSQDRFLATFFLGAFVWLLAQICGNQAAVWVVPGSYVARFLWIILGMGVAVAKLLPSPRTQILTDPQTDRAQTSLVSA